MTRPKTKRQFGVLSMCVAAWVITLFLADHYFPGQIDHLLIISVIVAVFFVAWAIAIAAEYANWYLSMDEDER